jgi:hypothetical protein
MATYVALQGSDLELVERLAGLVAVADILKGLGGVLAGNVEEDLLTAAVRIARVRIVLRNLGSAMRGAEITALGKNAIATGSERIGRGTYGCSSTNLVQS